MGNEEGAQIGQLILHPAMLSSSSVMVCSLLAGPKVPVRPTVPTRSRTIELLPAREKQLHNAARRAIFERQHHDAAVYSHDGALS